MKRAFAIFFLALFLFNIGGYYFIYWGLQSRAKSDLLHRLDADNYSGEDLIIISLPITLPYPLQEQGYERVDGEFEYQGEFYRLVKQRLEKDTLFMVCIKDHHKKKLLNVLNEYSSYVNNLPSSSDQTLDMFSKLFKDYTSISSTPISTIPGWSAAISHGERPVVFFDVEQPVKSPPPRV